MKGQKTVGFAMCGSFCTHQKSLGVLDELLGRGYRVIPIVSETVYATDTRFGTAEELVKTLAQKCGTEVVHTIRGAEPFGPDGTLDLLLICPCTGNTLAKMAAGITDTAVTMAAKAQLRADRPVLVALSTNDALSANFLNMQKLGAWPHVTLAPTHRDDPKAKPYSLVPDFEKIPDLVHKILAE